MQAEYDQMNDDIAAIHAEIEQVRMDADAAREKEEAAKKAAEQALASQMASLVLPRGLRVVPPRALLLQASLDGSNPAPGRYITSGFGWRASIGDYHQGVDLSCKYEPVYCMADGTVTTSEMVRHGRSGCHRQPRQRHRLVVSPRKPAACQRGAEGLRRPADYGFRQHPNFPRALTCGFPDQRQFPEWRDGDRC